MLGVLSLNKELYPSQSILIDLSGPLGKLTQGRHPKPRGKEPKRSSSLVVWRARLFPIGFGPLPPRRPLDGSCNSDSERHFFAPLRRRCAAPSSASRRLRRLNNVRCRPISCHCFFSHLRLVLCVNEQFRSDFYRQARVCEGFLGNEPDFSWIFKRIFLFQLNVVPASKIESC